VNRGSHRAKIAVLSCLIERIKSLDSQSRAFLELPPFVRGLIPFGTKSSSFTVDIDLLARERGEGRKDRHTSVQFPCPETSEQRGIAMCAYPL